MWKSISSMLQQQKLMSFTCVFHFQFDMPANNKTLVFKKT